MTEETNPERQQPQRIPHRWWKSYARGATDVPLIEQTIGAFLPTWWPASPTARRW